MTDEFHGQEAEYLPEPAYDDGGQAGGLNISDGIAQARAAYQPGDEIPGPAYEGGYGDELPYEGEGFEGDGHYEEAGYEPELSGEEQVQQLFQQAAQEAVAPYLAQAEWDNRVRDVQALADELPQLRSPETMEAVEDRIEEHIERLNLDPSARTDPFLIRQTLLAYEAEQAMAAGRQSPQGEPSPQQGQHVETGVGPGAQPGEVDPVAAAYAKALAPASTDDFGFPLNSP